MTAYPIRGVDDNGLEFWYTGKAGEAFVSRNRYDAFMGYELEGAQRVAKNLNRMSALHGLRFVAVHPQD